MMRFWQFDFGMAMIDAGVYPHNASTPGPCEGTPADAPNDSADLSKPG